MDPNEVGPVAVLEFWTQVLISQQLWHRDKGSLHLMDQLCKAAFRYMEEDCVQKLLYQQHKVTYWAPSITENPLYFQPIISFL